MAKCILTQTTPPDNPAILVSVATALAEIPVRSPPSGATNIVGEIDNFQQLICYILKMV